jgi:hypothetical protein
MIKMVVRNEHNVGVVFPLRQLVRVDVDDGLACDQPKAVVACPVELYALKVEHKELQQKFILKVYRFWGFCSAFDFFFWRSGWL